MTASMAIYISHSSVQELILSCSWSASELIYLMPGWKCCVQTFYESFHTLSFCLRKCYSYKYQAIFSVCLWETSTFFYTIKTSQYSQLIHAVENSLLFLFYNTPKKSKPQYAKKWPDWESHSSLFFWWQKLLAFKNWK